MTKLQNYDELEIDESPRVCGGTVFKKLMKKGKCVSTSQKSESLMLTSSSSFSSSQASSMIEYDPSKTHFCMPRQQVEGAGAGVGAGAAEAEDCYKLDFKLQAEEQSDFYYHNEANLIFGEEPHGIIKLNPQAINDLKTMHMQSVNGEREVSGIGPAFEPRSTFLAEKEYKTTESEDMEDAWNQLLSKNQAPYESKASILRKEMSLFRKELNAVKRSLPNQFDTNYFDNESDEREELEVSNETSQGQPKSKEPPGDYVDCDRKKYFKNDWDLNFRDEENNDDEDAHRELSQGSMEQEVTVQNSKDSSAILETNESFPECPEMPFDQGLSPEEIAPNNSSTPDEIESNRYPNTHDEERANIGSFTLSKQELEHIRRLSFLTARNSIQREDGQDDRMSSTDDSNYEEDMELVRKLLKKYGESIDNSDEKRRFDKARLLHAVVDPPTDAWFHRHATGVCRKSGKLSTPKADEAPNQSQSSNRMREHIIPEKPKQSYGTPELPQPKKTVHFKEPAAYDETEEMSVVKNLKSTPGLKTIFEDDLRPTSGTNVTTMLATRRSPGRLSDKIKFWEETKI